MTELEQRTAAPTVNHMRVATARLGENFTPTATMLSFADVKEHGMPFYDIQNNPTEAWTNSGRLLKNILKQAQQREAVQKWTKYSNTKLLEETMPLKIDTFSDLLQAMESGKVHKLTVKHASDNQSFQRMYAAKTNIPADMLKTAYGNFPLIWTFLQIYDTLAYGIDVGQIFTCKTKLSTIFTMIPVTKFGVISTIQMSKYNALLPAFLTTEWERSLGPTLTAVNKQSEAIIPGYESSLVMGYGGNTVDSTGQLCSPLMIQVNGSNTWKTISHY